MKSGLEGRCDCGKLRYRLTSPPMFVNCCHCLNCQRQTGSAFVINAIIEADRMQLIQGSPAPVVMELNGGSPQTVYRCPDCKVAVWSEYGGRSEARFVRAGTLDTPSEVSPGAHIFTRSKVPWLTLPTSVPSFEIYYDSEKLWPAESLARRKMLFG